MHYNVQIYIQRVQEPERVDSPGRAPSQSERKATSVLELKITADTEHEAYERVMKILSTTAPEPVTGIVNPQPIYSDYSDPINC